MSPFDGARARIDGSRSDAGRREREKRASLPLRRTGPRAWVYCPQSCAMPPEDDRRARVDSLLADALERPAARREAFLDLACAGEPGLRAEVAALLPLADGPAPELEPAALAAGALAQELVLELAGDEEPAAPERIGPWRLVAEIGRGGMGTVHRVERADGAFEQVAALKLIQHGADSAEIAGRFARERQILASLSHPNIARLLDGGRAEDGRPYLVMELVEGRPIDRYCDEERLSIDERLDLFGQVVRALQHAHRNLVVHRDLKPSNIVVTAAREVKLLDFGIAKLLSLPGAAGEALTRTLARVLTPEYASPEQILGQPVTTATDIYQLGLLLYELLTGQRAHRIEDSSPAALERAVCRRVPARPSTLVGETRQPAVFTARRTSARALRRRLRGDLDTIVLKALRKEPERRYASAQELLEDLARWRQRLPVRARPETLGYRVRTFVRRHPVGIGAAAGLASLLLIYAGTVTRQAQELARQRDQVSIEAAKAAQVRDFLIGLFQAADPYGDKGTSVTAGELLEAGARQVDDELADEPEVRAEMLGVLGQVLTELAAYERAEALVVEALAAERELHDGDHPDLSRALHRYAALLLERGEPAASERVAREALAMRSRILPQEHEEVSASLGLVAAAVAFQGRHAEAETLYREALALRRSTADGDDAEVATLLNNLGIELEKQEQYAAAEEVTRESLAQRRRLFDPDHAAVSESLNNLSVILNRQGRFADAEALLREALEIRRRVFGDGHPRVANTLNNLGELLRKMGRPDEAAACHREALAIRRAALGEEHPNVAASLHSLGIALRDGGDRVSAEELIAEALARFRRSLPAGHRLVSYPALALGLLLLERGDLEAAESLVVEALAIRSEAIGDDSAATAEAHLGLGLCRAAQGRQAEARELLENGLESLRGRTSGDPSLLAEAERTLASLR